MHNTYGAFEGVGTAERERIGSGMARGRAFGALLAAAATLPAQILMPQPEGIAHPIPSDLAVLEAQESRKDLPCSVDPLDTVLGFDLKFHAGYEATVPLKELGGGNYDLTMVFRVTPASSPESAAYFIQRIPVPKIDRDAKGDATLHGAFDLGEGKYRVSWLMRDGAGRFCASNWETEAALPPRDRQMPLDIAPDQAQAADFEPYRPEPAVLRGAAGRSLNLKLLVNFAPQDARASALQPEDTSALLAILRRISSDPQIGKVSVVAFNLQEQRVLYRQEDASEIDLPALGEALKSLKLGSVDLRILKEKHSDRDFLTDLLTTEIRSNPDPPDAVIIAGPKITLDSAVPQDALKEIGDVGLPVFYMNYALNPMVNPWRDAIGNAVRALKGSEYTISKPRDVFFAWSEISGRIVKSKFGKTPSVAASELK